MRKIDLAPLLTARSVAVVGASPRPGSLGNGMVRAGPTAGFTGRLYLVNPNHEAIDGRPCYPDIAALPEAVDVAALGVANHRLEAALGEAIAAGARSAVIFASCVLEESDRPRLTERLKDMAREAGLPVCGGNCSGFHNLDAKVRVGLGSTPAMTPGPVALISHSGSVYAAMYATGGRLDWNLMVNAGLEFTVSAADYLDFALDMPTTRAVGLFLETVRDPDGFVAALEKAARRDIPVVIVKVGRSPAGARFALSHSGAIAGADAAYEAIFDRYGVLRVADLDELVATLQLLSQPRRAGPGGLAAILDSGGERELLADEAEAAGVPFARISAATEAKLAARLEPGLDPVNPLDAWGTGNDFQGIFADCFAALAADTDSAAALWIADGVPGHPLMEAYAAAAREVAARCPKPLALATCLTNTAHAELTAQMRAAEVPLLQGTRPALTALRRLLDYRDARARPPIAPPQGPSAKLVARWRRRLAAGTPLEEAEGLALLGDFGLPVSPAQVVETAGAAASAAAALGYPVALKTAMPGRLHKTEARGVALGLTDESTLRAAYDDLVERLGPRCLVQPMAPGGLELALGAVIDAQFGPLVMVGAGGLLIEQLDDRRFAVAPLDAEDAGRQIDRLRLRPLLDGVRGGPPADRAALCRALVRLSVLAAELADCLGEVDINPIIVGPDGCVAVDALILPAKEAQHVANHRGR